MNRENSFLFNWFNAHSLLFLTMTSPFLILLFISWVAECHCQVVFQKGLEYGSRKFWGIPPLLFPFFLSKIFLILNVQTAPRKYFTWQCFNAKKLIYTLNGWFHNIAEVTIGWQLLDHKIQPANPQNDQHLVADGQDWLEHHWMKSL